MISQLEERCNPTIKKGNNTIKDHKNRKEIKNSLEK